MDFKNGTERDKQFRGAAWKSIDLERLTLSSYGRLCTLIAVCIGVPVCAIFFIVDLVGADTSIHWGSLNLSDTETGFVMLFVGPFMFAIAGFIGSLLSYHLFLWALRRSRGLSLTGKWKEIVPPEVHGDTQPGHSWHLD